MDKRKKIIMSFPPFKCIFLSVLEYLKLHVPNYVVLIFFTLDKKKDKKCHYTFMIFSDVIKATKLLD